MQRGESCAGSMSVGRGAVPQRLFDTANFEVSDFSPLVFLAAPTDKRLCAKVALAGAMHKHAQEFSHGTGTTKLNGKLRTPARS